MKNIIFILIVFSAVFAQNNSSCSMCELNKTQLKCDYYVDKNGDITKIKFCLEYASYLYNSKVYGKASWYYLLSKDIDSAIKSAENAIKAGEFFAYEYIMIAYLIKDDIKKAKQYHQKLIENTKNMDFFIKNDIKTLSKIYKNITLNPIKINR